MGEGGEAGAELLFAMAAKYRKIDQKVCEVELLDLGETLTRHAPLDINGARRIWECALDGNKVTERERNSIEHIAKNARHGLSQEAQAFFTYWLADAYVSKLHGAKVQLVDGVHCDRVMIQVADHYRSTAGVIGIRGAEGIWFSALDGRGVTHREKQTLEVILRSYEFDDQGRTFLEFKMSWLFVAADALLASSDSAQHKPEAVVMRRADAIALEMVEYAPLHRIQASQTGASGSLETVDTQFTLAPGLAETGSSPKTTLVAATSVLRSGCAVRLHGLDTSAFNDLPGTCEEWDDVKQRWLVRLHSGETKALKPSNLLAQGRCVSLKGLAAVALNGLHGVCGSWNDKKQRWNVQLDSGEIKSVKPENLQIEVALEAPPSEVEHSAPDSEDRPAKRRRCDASKVSLEKLRNIFDKCDVNKDGQVSKRELIKTCRQDGEVAEFFNLPMQVRQEDGSRSKLEEVFQSIDTDGDREIRWAELLAFYRLRVHDF
eukprot:TRINITY_DN6774_c0_g3_i1.p1 TRINITY_DN6774_c0_g3~~TRINITY_DN6774_c0_g3_i1.p1  ORF type:complete len:489 (-),score=65.82 TRINITY_DN6774_c0_g3_i1:493-1959(-)